MRTLLTLLVAAGAAAGCHPSDGFDGCTRFVAPAADADATHDAVQTALGDAQPGDVICFQPGTYALHDEVTLATPNVELRGSRAGRAIFDFSGQRSGANGVAVAADGFLMQHLTVKNSAGQGIRIQKSTGVTLRDVEVTWDAGPMMGNGGYGIYPTECTDVVITQCQVSYASDAGVYVGQSHHIVVDHDETFGNVIGIEIENSDDAEVMHDDSHDNVGGILAFNLPFLPRKGTHRVTIHDNQVHDNNQETFAAPGSIVRQVPAGTGIMVVAADEIEVHHNHVEHNDSIGIGDFSFLLTMDDGWKKDAGYNPYPHDVWIHDNSLAHNGENPRDQAGVIASVLGVDTVEQLVWDGAVDPAATEANAGTCFSHNGAASFRNLDFANSFANSSTDVGPVTCTRAPLGAEGPYAPVPVAPRRPVQPHETLSAYGFFTGPLAQQTPAPGVVPYEVAAPLYADGAGKLRFMVLPAGGKIGFDPTGHWTFPEGTTFIKTFYADDGAGGRKLLETRLEMRLDGAWTLQTYLWDDAQTEATRFVPGRTVTRPDGTPYRVPSSDQCPICHASNAVPVPLGPRTRQLNRDVMLAGQMVNQLDQWAAQGFFATPPPPASTLEHLVDPMGNDALDARARSYLDANCSHCHSMGGTASSTNLRLDLETTDWTQLGVCKGPVSAGPGSGSLMFDVVPGDPAHSIVVYRMSSTEPEVKMPQLPTLTADAAGVQLVSDWIQSLQLPACPAQ